jgi:alginate O-acetyltransferase complex protein AlgI
LIDFSALFRYQPGSPMLFNSGLFLGFFTVFISVYALIYRQKPARTLWIIAFSLFFYYKSSGTYLFILLASVLLDYLIAWHLHTQKNEKERRFWLVFSIVANLGLLAYFKYTDFLLLNFAWLSGQKFEPLALFLPVGISFYTFQTISYVVDVYNRKIAPAESLADYAFYMTFFPHLVAGPIVRASHFLPQIDRPIQLTQADVSEGIFLIVRGLIKKAVIADYISQYADLVFGTPGGYSGFECLIAVYTYTLQIYCDFSGYSDMAIGLAKIMGFDLGENFRSPYKALNLTDFWRRWHISLSSWLRDYVYIPLGGNRKSEARQKLNLLITMLLGGLWHGADWKFVFWGGMHGLGLITHRLFEKIFPHLPEKGFPAWVVRLLSGLLTFHFVAMLWVFFRADSFTTASLLLQKAFIQVDWAYFLPFVRVRGGVLLMLAVGYILHLLPQTWKHQSMYEFSRLPVLAKMVLVLLVFQIIIQLQSENVQPFIYFQF